MPPPMPAPDQAAHRRTDELETRGQVRPARLQSTDSKSSKPQKEMPGAISHREKYEQRLLDQTMLSKHQRENGNSGAMKPTKIVESTKPKPVDIVATPDKKKRKGKVEKQASSDLHTKSKFEAGLWDDWPSVSKHLSALLLKVWNFGPFSDGLHFPLQEADFAKLCCYMFPDPLPMRINLAAVILALTLLLDDHMETLTLGDSIRFYRPLYDIARGAESPNQQKPLECAIGGTFKAIRELDETHANNIVDQMFTIIRVHTSADDVGITTLKEFFRYRMIDAPLDEPTKSPFGVFAVKLYARFTSLVQALGCFCLNIPASFKDNPELQEVKEIFGKHVIVMNDVLSWEREQDAIAKGLRPNDQPIYSAVHVFAKEMKLDHAMAKHILVSMCRDWEKKFLEHKAEIQKGFKYVHTHESNIAAYIEMLKNAMAGSEQWSKETRRHQYPVTVIGKMPFGRVGRVAEFSPPFGEPLVDTPDTVSIIHGGKRILIKRPKDTPATNTASCANESVEIPTPRVRSHISEDSSIWLRNREALTCDQNLELVYGGPSGAPSVDSGSVYASLKEEPTVGPFHNEPERALEIRQKGAQSTPGTFYYPEHLVPDRLPDDYLDPDEIEWYANQKRAADARIAYEQRIALEQAAARRASEQRKVGNSSAVEATGEGDTVAQTLRGSNDDGGSGEDSIAASKSTRPASPSTTIRDMEDGPLDPLAAWINEPYVATYVHDPSRGPPQEHPHWVIVPTRSSSGSRVIMNEGKGKAKERSSSGSSVINNEGQKRTLRRGGPPQWDGCFDDVGHRDGHNAQATDGIGTKTYQDATSPISSPRTLKEKYLDGIRMDPNDCRSRYKEHDLVGSTWFTTTPVDRTSIDKSGYKLLSLAKEEIVEVIFVGSKGYWFVKGEHGGAGWVHSSNLATWPAFLAHEREGLWIPSSPSASKRSHRERRLSEVRFDDIDVDFD